MAIGRKFTIALFTGATVTLATGCGSYAAEPSLPSPWEHEFHRIYNETDSDFIRSIVADGELTLQEMREATVRTHECFESAGTFSFPGIGMGPFLALPHGSRD